MTSQKFHHRYTPAGQGTDGLDPITLTTTDIGEAAIREIVQISLTSAPFGVFLEQLRLCPLAWCSFGVATTITGLGRIDQAARLGRLTRGSSPIGAMLSRVM